MVASAHYLQKCGYLSTWTARRSLPRRAAPPTHTSTAMKAIGLTKYLPITDPSALVDLELADPRPGGHDLLVSVRAISVNPVDTKVRAPKAGVEDPPKILGWDAAGVVEAVGPDVTLFAPGDEVFYAGSITRPGTNSELHLVDERIVGKKPASLDFAGAAALPLTSITRVGSAVRSHARVTHRREEGPLAARARRCGRRRVHRDPDRETGRGAAGDRNGVARRVRGRGASSSALTTSSTTARTSPLSSRRSATPRSTTFFASTTPMATGRR